MPEEPEEPLDSLPPGTRARISGVIIAAIVLVFVIVYLLSDGGAEFFAPKIVARTYLSDSAGLVKDADVVLNGVPVGKVFSVHLSKSTAQSSDPNRAVEVDMRIEKRFVNKIPVDSIAALTADNLLGDKFINITRGKALESITDGSEIPSLIQSGSYNPADMIASLQATVQRVNELFGQIQRGDTPLAQFINGSDFYTQLLTQMAAVHQTIQDTAGPKTQLGQMLFSDAFYNKTRQPILNIDHMLEETQRGENSAGKLLNSSATYDNAVQQIHAVHRSLDDFESGKGSGGELLKSDAQYRKLEAQIQSINKTLDQLTTGTGRFPQLLESRQLYDSVEVKSRTTGTFLREFRGDPRKFLRIMPFGSKHPKKP